MNDFKPMRGCAVDFSLLDYSNLLMSPKLDGIRVVVRDGKVYSKTLKPIPSKLVQHLFGRPEFNGLDGEMIVGTPTSKTVYNDTYRVVMKKDGEGEISLYAFDHFTEPNIDYEVRLERAKEIAYAHDHVKALHHYAVLDEAHILSMEDSLLGQGYEGMMLRAARGPNSHYKYGKSTPSSNTLLKLKRFVDDEAEIIGYEEEMKNNNEAYTNEVGETKRSSHQENKVGKGRMGKLICRRPSDGAVFGLAGFTDKEKDELWAMRDELAGNHLARYKHFNYGAIDAPRLASFLGLRSKIDV